MEFLEKKNDPSYKDSEDFKRRIFMSKMIAAFFFALAIIWSLILHQFNLPMARSLSLVVAISCLLSVILHYFGKDIIARFLWMIMLMLVIFVGDSIGGVDSRINSMLVMTIVVPHLLFSWKYERSYVVFFFLSSLILWFITVVTEHQLFPILEISPQVARKYIAAVTDLTIFSSLTVVIYSFSKEVYLFEDRLQAALNAAKHATKSKSEFLANMSHEVRTPLNGILGMVQLTLRTDLDTKQHKYLSTTLNQAKGMLRIINDILDFSKIEAGKLDIEKTTFDLNILLESLLEVAKLKTDEKDCFISFEISDDVPNKLIGDPLRLTQALSNFVTNAIKFTPAGGNIKIKVSVLEQDVHFARLHFSVHDTGIGISPEDLDKLFKPFSQVDTSNTRMYGGTGLGLSISKNLIEIMGGEISVESNPGEGSIFKFSSVFEKQTKEKIPKVTTAIEAAVTSGSFLKGIKILIVDDNEINRELLVEVLGDKAADIKIATNGKEAIELIENEKFDLVLMDCQMPVMDGYETTRNIRKHDRFKDLPIIAFTASAMKHDRDRALEAGMSDYISKPIDPEKLIILIDMLVKI